MMRSVDTRRWSLVGYQAAEGSADERHRSDSPRVAHSPMPGNRQPAADSLLRTILFTFVLAASILSSSAQTVGKLRLMVDPGNNFQFVLDHKYRMQQREVELVTGPHHFSFWAPERKIVDTTLYVAENQTKEVLLRLPFSEEYRRYEEELRDLKKRMWLEVALPSAVTLGAGILTYSTYKQYQKAHDQLLADEEAYRSGADPEALASLKSDVIPRHKEEFADKRGVFYASLGLFTAVAAGSAWMIIRYNKRPDPKFFDHEKVKFDGLVWLPGTDGEGLWLTGVHMDLR